MVFPEDFDFERREAREQIAEGDISVSETVSGHDIDDEGMHIMDEEEFERLEDPYDADGYLEDEDQD